MSFRFRGIVRSAKAALFLVLSSPSVLLHAQAADVKSIEGLWGAETRFGIPVEGEVTLDGREGIWKASIGGYEVPATVIEQQVTFSLPSKLGAFKGRFDAVTQDLRGQWIQPGGVILDPQYASPLVLHKLSANVWRGSVVPLEQRVSVYLLISSHDGKLTAIVSNPEGNYLRRRVYSVTQDDNKISLEAKGKKFIGLYDQQSGNLSIQLVDWLPPFSFTPRTPQDGVGFYPRVPPESQHWAYSEPVGSNDGWSVSTLKEERVDQKSLAKLMERILQADPSSTSLKIQSLLIARHGHLIMEEYFYGFTQDRVHDMRSAGKTFAPVLVGLARQGGVKLEPATPVYPLLSKQVSSKNPDERKKSMTLRDIMTMTAGNACDDNDDNSPGNEDRMQSDAQQPDWYQYTLDLPMLSKPGGDQAIYCSGDLNLVGGAVAASTKMWLPEFFETHLARPLQFGRYYLNLMPSGEAYMGGGAYLTPRDQLKLGQLYLAGGVWNGQRIVSKDWVTDSTSVHSHFAKEHSLGQEHGYGYGWHLHELRSGGKVYKTFAAEGNGGQFVIAIPSLDLVVGITGGAYGEFDQWYRWELELLPEFIIPAAATE